MRKEIEIFVLDTIFATSLTACSIAIYNNDGWLPLNSGLILASGIGLARHHLWKRAQSSYNNHRRRLAQMASIQKVRSFDPDFNRFEMRWKEHEPIEFIFTGDILPIPVLRSEFYQLIEIACTRQRQAIYGTRYNRHRPKINWVLSERYFTQVRRPRFHKDLYWSIIIILSATRLKRGGGQGDSGHLIGEYGPNRYTELAIQRWLSFYGPPTKKRQSIFYAILPTSRT